LAEVLVRAQLAATGEVMVIGVIGEESLRVIAMLNPADHLANSCLANCQFA